MGSHNFAKDKSQLTSIRKAANISMKILREIVNQISPGVSAFELDQLAIELCEKNNVRSAFKDYSPRGLPPFPSTVSICVNDEVVHGISSKEKIIQNGDLVTADFGIIYEGYFTDHCVTVGVGEIGKEDKRLLETAKLAVTSSISQVRLGKTTGDIGHAMHSVAKLAGFDVVKAYIGHGIGKSLHEAPELPAYGTPGSGVKLQKGMVLCLEAQVVAGTDKIKTDKDNWTVRTADGKNCAWFEYMVLVTDKNPEVLTDTRDWPLCV